VSFFNFEKKSEMDFDFLSRSPVFRGLSAGETESVLGGVRYRTRSYLPGSVIALSGDEVTSLQIVAKGLVKGEMVDYSGRVLKIEDIAAPRALAPAFLFGSDNRYPVNVTAVTESILLIIGKRDFVSLLCCNETILTNYLDMISSRSQFLSERIRFITFRTIKGKLANYLLEHTTVENPYIRLNLTQQELSDFFGVARPSLARAIREMEEGGVIESSGKEFRVTDRPTLLSVAAGLADV